MIELLIQSVSQVPEWAIWTAYGLMIYFVLSIYPFGCPFCGLPDLAWGPKLVAGVFTSILWRLDLWPEKWTEYCDECGDVLPPNERRIEKYKPDEGHFKVCDNECSKNLDQRLEDQEDD